MLELHLLSNQGDIMNLNDTFKPTGELEIVVRGPDGNIKEIRQAKNLVVAAGKTYIASRIVSGSASAIMSHMAIGTGTATPVSTDTTLGTEAGRVVLASASNAANAITYTATFPAGTGTGAITEAAVLNLSSGGTMLCRTTFPVVNKAAGDSIAVTWVVTIS
jgi:hypothetical protein